MDLEVEASSAAAMKKATTDGQVAWHLKTLETSEPTEWHLQFAIPELKSFSQHVKSAVDTDIVTGRARREIIQVLRTYMTTHTVYPTSEQYKTVCKKLITKFPSLKDEEGTRYVSTIALYAS